MNYQIRYNNLINNALYQNRIRTKDKYFENHHIKPRCLGGNDDKENLVWLTAKEHFVAHHLLSKIHGGKLWYAFKLMCSGGRKGQERNYKITSTVFENMRIECAKEHSKLLKGRYAGKGNPNYGKVAWNRGKERSIETKNKIRNTKLGHVQSEETKKKISETKRKKELIKCKYCDMRSTASNISRWHNDNCKKRVA